jgi:asparagine synthase (glutamine-hydrolysing)
MCGIAGIVEPGGVPSRERVEQMAAALVHRGPDDDGFHVGPDVALGFRRLSIIDLATGNQPATNESGSIVAVFNGEIYNFRELRADLERRGRRFRTQGDAEVLPHLYEEHGESMVERLRGMFAFAIWDGRTNELLLARDRLGQKPLYYSRLPTGGLAFASEIGGLLAGGVSREPDLSSLVEYLRYLYVPAPHSAFRAIAQLEPGQTLQFGRDGLRLKTYWRPSSDIVERPDTDHVEELRERTLDAVRSHLVADVPLGAFLSGGVDSPSVVAAMCRVHSGPVHTFTITFEGFEAYDESAEARAIAQHLGTEHHELRATLAGPEALPEIVRSFGDPFGNATAALVKSLSSVTREHVKVVLTGDGADELLFGYPRFRGIELLGRYQRLTPSLLRRLGAAAARAIPESTSGRHGRRRAREFATAGTRALPAAYSDWVSYFGSSELDSLLGPELRSAEARRPSLEEVIEEETFADLNALSRVELRTFLPNNVLTYADRMSMAHSLELRAPFLDHELVEFVGTLPPSAKLRGGMSKWALREAMAPDLPAGAMNRPKRGLNPPLGAWLRDQAAPLVRELLGPEAVRRRGLLQPDAVARLITEQRRGFRDRSQHIWGLLVLELWCREVLEGT